MLGVGLAGGFARNVSDRLSDVDLVVVVAPDEVDACCEDWPGLCAEITPTIPRRRVGDRPLFNQITPDWLRFDLAVESPEQPTRRTRSTTSLLYDPHDLAATLRTPGPPRQPEPARVASIVQEFLRVLGLLPVVVARGEFVVGASGVALLRSGLADGAGGRGPPPHGGDPVDHPAPVVPRQP